MLDVSLCLVNFRRFNIQLIRKSFYLQFFNMAYDAFRPLTQTKLEAVIEELSEFEPDDKFNIYEEDARI